MKERGRKDIGRKNVGRARGLTSLELFPELRPRKLDEFLLQTATTTTTITTIPDVTVSALLRFATARAAPLNRTPTAGCGKNTESASVVTYIDRTQCTYNIYISIYIGYVCVCL